MNIIEYTKVKETLKIVIMVISNFSNETDNFYSLTLIQSTILFLNISLIINYHSFNTFLRIFLINYNLYKIFTGRMRKDHTMHVKYNKE